MKNFYTLALAFLVVSGAFAQLSGTKTIGGASPDYATIRDAFNALSTSGVTAPGVTFLIRDGVYNEDSLVIRWVNSSVSAPILVKPDAGATVVINVSPTTDSSAIRIDSTKYVTIEGSNNGTSSRNMTISANGSQGWRGIYVVNSSEYVTIKNCIVRTGWTPATDNSKFDCIRVTTVRGGKSCNYLLLDNNLCRNAYRGIYAYGAAIRDTAVGFIIRNNVVDSVSTAGIWTGWAAGSLVYNNEISILNSQATGTDDVYGIYIGGGSDFCRAYNNRLHDINIAAGGTAAVYGISASTQASGHGGNVIYNNFVSMNITRSASTGSIYALYDGMSTYKDSILFNTVKLIGGGTSNRTAGAFYEGSGTGGSVAKNNLLILLRTDGTTGIATVIGRPSTMASPTDFISDYNNLYAGPTLDAQHKIGRISTTYYTTLADWQANNYDAVSVSTDVPFVSATDLHVPVGTSSPIRNGGTPIPGYTTDIDGQTRNASAPDIGADEFSGATGVECIGSQTPTSFVVEQNYPNPFNPVTEIRFQLPIASDVNLQVHDILGRVVETLVNESLPSGSYRVQWAAKANTSGIYFYTLRAGNESFTRRMVLLK